MGNNTTEDGDGEDGSSPEEAAVLRGIGWLNATGRSDWYEVVYWDLFDFNDGRFCVLGWTIGDVFKRPALLGMTMAELAAFAVHHGFVSSNRTAVPFTDSSLLAAQWRAKGTALLAAQR